MDRGRPYCLINGPTRIPTAEELCKQQIDCHRAIYFYCQGVYERYYREHDKVYAKDFQYDGVYAKDFPDSGGPWPNYEDAWDAYVKAWSHIYGNEHLQRYPEMREAILNCTFRPGMHTLLWPGWRWILIKDNLHIYRSRIGEFLFPTVLDNGGLLPRLLESSADLVSLRNCLSQVDISKLYPRREEFSQVEKNMAELDAAFGERILHGQADMTGQWWRVHF